MAKISSIRDIISDINKDIPATQEELEERALAQTQEKRDREVEKEIEEAEERERETRSGRRRPARIQKFASKKKVARSNTRSRRAAKEKAKIKAKARAKAKAKIRLKERAILEIQRKEQQPEDFVNIEPVVIEQPAPDTEILSVGRLLRVVPQSVFGPSVREYTKDSDPSKDETFVEDALRGRFASYWTIGGNRNNRQFVFVNDERRVRSYVPFKMTFNEPDDVEEDTDFGRTEEWVDIRGFVRRFRTAKSQYSKDYWRAYVEGKSYEGSTKKGGKFRKTFNPTVETGPASVFMDHVHEMPLPFSKKELKKLNTPLRGLSANITPEYNFFIKGYENKIGEDRGVLENTLPNMYIFLSELNEEDPNPDFKNFITLDDTFVVEDQIFTRKEKREKFDIKEHPIGQYYDIYARQYDNARRTGAINRLNRRFSNLLLSVDDVSLIKEFNEKREMFPMYVDIEFSTDKTTTFAQILKDTNLSNAFVSRVANRIIDGEAAVMPCQQSIETVIQEAEQSNPRKITSFSGVQKRYWNIADLLQNLIEANEELNPTSAIYLGDYENETKTLNGKEFDFFKTLMFTIFFGKLQKLIKQKFRTFEEVMDGESAYSETVLYRVAKYEGDANGPLLQNYFFPNSNEIDVLRFIDTQVKYDKKYTYVVYAYQLVIGNEYSYQDLETANMDQHALFKVLNEPSLLLFEHEFFTFTGNVLDDPPIAPDIDVIPYKGIDDRVLVLMNGNVGNFVTDPIIIRAEDEEAIQKLRRERQVDPGNPIRFKADDHVATFEVYRTDFLPESYRDFEKNLRAVVNTDVSLQSLQAATAGSFVDRIEPNKRYYYTFRAIDNHGNFSNPTPIIRIEMISENGTVFMLKDVVDFAELPKMSTKPARRYIQLVPSVLQSLINEDKSGFDKVESASELKSKVHLGVSDEPLWGKKFRIRLTSKSTGKKVDLKVRFEHEHKEKA